MEGSDASGKPTIAHKGEEQQPKNAFLFPFIRIYTHNIKSNKRSSKILEHLPVSYWHLVELSKHLPALETCGEQRKSQDLHGT